MLRTRPVVLLLSLAALAGTVRADERLEGIACRSVHLGYTAGEGTAFTTEVTVDKSAPGSYFCAIGWNKGYYGIQELGNGKKVVIFSVWDSGQNNPKAVEENKQVKVIHKDEKVRTGRFGGEGTGGQSFLDFDWRVGETYRFFVASKPTGDRTEFAGYFRAPDDKDWKHLITFSTVTGGKNLGGFYSFVEDFKRDKVSTTKVRSARYGNAWVRTTKGEWEAVTKARFTADANPVTNINAGIAEGKFLLATGGDTKNADTKLKDTLQLPDAKRTVPDGFPKTN